MTHQEIVTQLSLKYSSEEILISFTMSFVYSEIVRLMGEEALALSLEDLLLCREEVLIAIDHGLDIRDFVSQGVDAWQIVRNL